MAVKFPNITVKDFGRDGNAFALLGQVQTAMRKGGCTKEEVDAFINEATNGDYSHLLATCGEYVNLDMGRVSDDIEEEDDDEELDFGDDDGEGS
jgi:hypothetical protein